MPNTQPMLLPQYDTLLAWMDAWPNMRPELLDFWSRGSFGARLALRRHTAQPACAVRVRYVDELSVALRRLALLNVAVDFIWCGDTAGASLTVVPLDIDYEGPGGWGYTAASGDEIADPPGNREWCPAFGFADRLPDAVTDWLVEDARPWFAAGDVVVCPHENVGLPREVGSDAEAPFQRYANAASIAETTAAVETIFALDLPRVDGLSLRDLRTFCADHADHLQMFQRALHTLIRPSASDWSDTHLRAVVEEIEAGVAELRLGARASGVRKRLAAAGGVLATTAASVALQVGVAPAAVALGSLGAAIGVIAHWDRILDSGRTSTTNPLYVLWKLDSARRAANTWRPRPLLVPMTLPRPTQLPPYHWLAPPTGGWLIPTFFLPPS